MGSISEASCWEKYWVNVVLGRTRQSQPETGKTVVFFRWAARILSEWGKTISTLIFKSPFYWWKSARLTQAELSHQPLLDLNRTSPQGARPLPGRPVCTLDERWYLVRGYGTSHKSARFSVWFPCRAAGKSPYPFQRPLGTHSQSVLGGQRNIWWLNAWVGRH